MSTYTPGFTKCPTCGGDASISDTGDGLYLDCYADCNRGAPLPLRTVRPTRYSNGQCDACGFDLYEDGETRDTHAPDCAALIPPAFTEEDGIRTYSSPGGPTFQIPAEDAPEDAAFIAAARTALPPSSTPWTRWSAAPRTPSATVAAP
jgi:hypothetical protein